MGRSVKENTSVGGSLRPSGSELVTRVRAVLPSLTPAGARVAQLIVEDPAEVARCTISELAARARTSESTIVRTARALGFAGYPELRLALAAAATQPNEHVVTGDITPTDPVQDVVAKLAATEAQAIEETAAKLDAATLEGAMQALTEARRVDVYGVGASGLVANDLQQKLMRIGVVSHAYTELHLAVTSAVLLGPGDVVVAVSHSGETIDVLRPVRLAKEAGATTVAITSRPRSPLAGLADFVLVSTSRQESAFRPGALASRISQLLIVDCLFVGVAQRMYEQARVALRASHDALSGQRASGRRHRA